MACSRLLKPTLKEKLRESLTQESGLEEVYTRYAETRPGGSSRSCPDGLFINDPVFEKLFLPFLPINKDARIVDLGCGYGEFLSFLEKMGYTNTFGVDLDPIGLEIARGRGVKNVKQADAILALRESQREFDVISAIDVLEHVPKVKVLEFLRTVYGALRPGGSFLCQVPNLAAFYSPLFYMDFTHETPFTPTSLRQALEIANFEDVRIRPMGPVVHGLKSAVRAGLWWLINSGFRFIQLVESARHDPIDSIFTAAIFAVAKKAQSRNTGR
jgi:2-polyprenyl-3-methyl-5-hydroxy-6-metoxy-1,4-benzoquinol methylase